MAKPKQTPTIPQILRKRRADIIIRQGYLSLLVKVLVLVLVIYVALNHVFLITQISGNDMFPALEDGDLIFAYRLQEDYAKNDVIAFEIYGETKIGRIIGRGDDVVKMDDSGTLLLNGTTQGGEIMYPTYAKIGIEYPYVVPAGSYFILCDYRTQCEDSRDFGPIAQDQILGKVITILRRRGI